MLWGYGAKTHPFRRLNMVARSLISDKLISFNCVFKGHLMVLLHQSSFESLCQGVIVSVNGEGWLRGKMVRVLAAVRGCVGSLIYACAEPVTDPI